MDYIKWIEAGILGVVALFQLYYFIWTRARTKEYGTFFPEKESLFLTQATFWVKDIEDVNIDQVQKALNEKRETVIDFTKSSPQPAGSVFDRMLEPDAKVKLINVKPAASAEFEEIQQDVNIYLIKNKNHVTDFRIIREITERHGQQLYNQIDLTLHLPLYLGLLGTMLGVIIGVGQLGLASAEGGGFDLQSNSIAGLLTSVAMAMFVSGLGLLLTTSNSWYFKNMNARLEQRRNGFYTFIQTELLPVLSKDIAGAMTTFQHNLDRFNRNFTDNLTQFSKTVSTVQEGMAQGQQYLQVLRDMKLDQLVHANLLLFERMSDSAENFTRFSDYLKELERSSGILRDVVTRMDDLFGRFEQFEKNLQTFVDRAGKQESTLDKAFDFFTSNEQDITDRKAKLDRLITDLDNRTGMLMEAVYDHSRLQLDKLKTLADKEIDAISQIYESRKDTFANLDRLEQIETHLRELPDLIRQLTERQDQLYRQLTYELRRQAEERAAAAVVPVVEEDMPASGPLSRMRQWLNGKKQ